MTTDFQKGFTGPLLTAPGSVFGIRWWLVSALLDQRIPLVQGVVKAWTSPQETGVCEAHRLHTVCITYGGRVWSSDTPATTHRVPDEDCTCGFYAYWDPNATAPMAVGQGATLVCGVIEGFGKTLIGDKGFRSERAQIRGVVPVYTAPMEERLTPFDDYPIPPVTTVIDYVLVHRAFDRWDVPVYTNMPELLAAHPPTTDYRQLTQPPASLQAPEPGSGPIDPVHP